MGKRSVRKKWGWRLAAMGGKGGWGKSNQNALYTCMKLARTKRIDKKKKKLIQKKHEM